MFIEKEGYGKSSPLSSPLSPEYLLYPIQRVGDLHMKFLGMAFCQLKQAIIGCKNTFA
jgi:hypothetical protein